MFSQIKYKANSFNNEIFVYSFYFPIEILNFKSNMNIKK